MATSGVTSLGYTAGDLIREAFDILGVSAEGDALSPEDMAKGLRSLNLMTLTWSLNPHLWIKTEGTIVPLLGVASYALSPKPMRVISMRQRQTYGGVAADVPMEKLSYEQYFDLPNKGSQGLPNSFFYDSQRDTGTVYIWNTPNAGFVSAGALPYTYERKMEVITGLTQSLDWPQEWFEAIAFNLARRLMVKYPANGTFTAQDIIQQAGETFAALTAFDQEIVSIFLQPAYQGRA